MVKEEQILNYSDVKLSVSEFKQLSNLIMEYSGIKMPRAKKVMLEARLQKRLRLLKFGSFSEYCEFLFSPAGMDSEFNRMIDAVTTNKTDFFREPEHFKFLQTKLLPQYMTMGNGRFDRKFTVWSAASSTGEEPYTLAMVLQNFKEIYPKFNYEIFGSDICEDALLKARRAVYTFDKVEPVPINYKQNYLLRRKDRSIQEVRIVPQLRKVVKFLKVNLSDSQYPVPQNFDLIFCRNVFIYFERDLQERIVNNFYDHLKPNGYLFLGHSETINGMNVPFKQVSPTVYQKV